MKKIVLGLLFFTFSLSGCASNNDESVISSNTSDSIVTNTETTSNSEAVDFQVFSPTYTLDRNEMAITGTAPSGNKIQVLHDLDELGVVEAKDGKFRLYLPLEDSDTDEIKYTIKSNESSFDLNVKTKRYLQNLALKKSNQKKDNNTSSFSSSFSSSSSSPESSTQASVEESSAVEEIITKADDDQTSALIAWVQMSAEDNGYQLSYRGKDTWNIVLNYISGTNNWIVTTTDKNYGRVKAIYKWSGEKEDGADLEYLLINGNELINKLGN